MTDFNKYSNVTVPKSLYQTITKLQTKIIPNVELSRTKVVTYAIQKIKKEIESRSNLNVISLPSNQASSEKLKQ